MMICSSLFHPFVAIDNASCWFLACSLFLPVDILPMPSINLIVISGQDWSPCGHSFLASLKTIMRSVELHSSRMWLIDSVVRHLEQISSLFHYLSFGAKRHVTCSIT